MKLVFNAHIYTGSPKTWASGMLVNDQGRIQELFETEHAVQAAWKKITAKHIEEIDLRGAWVLPSFEDAHNHPVGHARALCELDFRGQNISWEEAQQRIRATAEHTPANEWIVCHGWNETTWGSITAQMLDTLSTTHGIILANISYHSGVVNSCGQHLLTQQGILCETENGVLHEAVFEEAFDATSPPIPRYAEAVLQFHEQLFALGITAVHDIEIRRVKQLAVYDALEQSGKILMPTEVYVMPEVLLSPELSHYMKQPWKQVHIRGVKLVLDGAFGGSTAAMRKPYSDGTGVGMMRLTREHCEQYIRRAAELGLSDVAMHCIGDRAIDIATELFEDLQKEYATDIKLWRFEHYELPSARSIRVLAERGGVASMQPNFLWDAKNYQQRVGKRVQQLNPFRTILDSSAQLVFSSDDAPSGPFEGIDWAVNRAPYPNQRVTFEEAFTAYTLSPARIIGKDHERGSLAVGKQTHFIVLNENPFTISPEQLSTLRIQHTWYNGKNLTKKR